MRAAGILPEDAPDPRLAQVEQLKLMPVPVMGIVPQPSLEDTGTIGWSSAQDNGGYSEIAVGLTYQLWRNPHDRSDPVNLANLDEETRRAIEDVPPWPRPAWLVEHVQRMRYPHLWEAVRTTWHRDASERSALGNVMVEHANYILVNQYRRELGLGDDPGERNPSGTIDLLLSARLDVRVNGVDVPGMEIGSDPFVYGVGAELPGGGIVTAVIPRSELDRIRIQFSTRTNE